MNKKALALALIVVIGVVSAWFALNVKSDTYPYVEQGIVKIHTPN